MKILLISSGVLPTPCPGYGGLEMIVADLAIELNKLGHKITVLATNYSKLPEGIEVIECGEPGRISEHSMLDKIKDRLIGFDIIHDHSWQKIIYLYKKNYGQLKVISTLHGMNPYGNPPPVKYPNMVCLSNDHALRTSGQLGINTRWIYNGLNLDFYRFKKEKSNRLLFLGRFMPGKGAHIAIEVAKKTGLPLDLVGDDTMVESKDYVKRIMAYAMDSKGLITYWGPVPRERAVEFFQNAKAFLQCGCGTWLEPFGLVTAEALACGTKVVSLNNGATTELLEKHPEAGVICNSTDEMAKAVTENKIQAEDCRKYAETFDRKFMAKNYLTLYEEIIRGQEW